MSLFSNVDKKKNNRSRATYISIPVAVYGFEIYTSKVEEDFLTNSIIELYEYYNSCLCPNSIERVKDDLNLSASFVKLVIKNYLESIEENNDDSASGPEKKIVPTKKKRNIYLIFDLVTGEILPYILDDERKEKFTFQNDEEHGIRLSIGKSEVYTPHRIKAKLVAPYYLDAKRVSDFVREYYDYGKKAKHTPTSTGYVEYFDLICACYYDKRNTTNYSIHHPFINERAKWLEGDINLALKEDVAFKNKMELMKSSVDTKKLQENTQNNDFYRECEKALIKVYGEGINSHEAVKLQLIDLVMKYTVMVRHKKSNVEFEQLEAAKHDYYITMYTTIEQLFGYCFEANYVPGNHREYLKYVTGIDDSISGLYDLKKIASDFGFDDSGITGKEKFYKKQLLWLFNNQDGNNQSIITLIFANVIEATVNNEPHPFQYVVKEYKDLFENSFDEDIDTVINQARNMRNKSKHGNNKYLRWNYFDFQTFVFFLFDCIVLAPIKPDLKFDNNMFLGFEGLAELEKRVDDTVNNVSGLYPNLEKNDDAFEKAKYFIRASIVKNREFYTSADVLINEVINQFIYIVSQNSNETNISVVNKYLKKDATRTDVKLCISNILRAYNNATEVVGTYNPGNIRAKMYAEQMSTGNKLFYLLMLLDNNRDNNRPDILSVLLSNNPKFVEDVELWLKLRGHSEQYRVDVVDGNSTRGSAEDESDQTESINLSNEQIDVLKDRLLQTCDSICGYIFDIERKNKNGQK